MTNLILFRKDQDTEEEYSVCKSILKEQVVQYRSNIPSNSTVWGRYSVLPYYEELEQELKLNNSCLINSYEQHRYVADIENWYSDLKDYTPRTWFEWYNAPEGSYVVKGRTNSRKHEWNKRMFAKTKADVPIIVNRLLDDCLISEQGVCIREYVPLKTYSYGINGLPFTNEWRFFCYKKNLLAWDYYWQNANQEDIEQAHLDIDGMLLVNKVMDIVSDNINFYVIDIAQTQVGDWIVIELNDGMMSGLSCIDPVKFYKVMFSLLK